MNTLASGRGAAGLQGGWRYGALGLPLAFVALPLYVVLPNHYADRYGVPLVWLGAVLLGARLLDALADPLIGRWIDGLLSNARARLQSVLALAALVLTTGFAGLFFPPVTGSVALLVWCAAALAVTYLSYSVLTVAHQAWGARLGGDETQRARVVAWREALALVGVLVASVLPSVAGLKVTVVVFGVALFIGLAALRTSARPHTMDADVCESNNARPLSTGAFRRLLAVYLLNGIASAIPATLVLFFIRDRLQVPAWEPVFLAGYFAAGAVSIPLWVRCVKRFGLPRTWLAGMLLAVATFAWAATLGAGDATAFLLVCVLSGVALGADLSLPSALLAGVIQQAGHSGQREGAYFGWWNFATKLNLALAAGVALPALQLFGYAPGSRDAAALTALTAAYCLLPCVLKLCAAALLFTQWVRPSISPLPSPPLLKDLP